ACAGATERWRQSAAPNRPPPNSRPARNSARGWRARRLIVPAVAPTTTTPRAAAPFSRSSFFSASRIRLTAHPRAGAAGAARRALFAARAPRYWLARAEQPAPHQAGAARKGRGRGGGRAALAQIAGAAEPLAQPRVGAGEVGADAVEVAPRHDRLARPQRVGL